MEFIKNFGGYFGPSLQGAMFTVLQAVAIFAIGWWVINAVCKFVLLFFQKSFKDVGVASLLESILKFSLRVLLIVAVLQHLGFEVTAILAAIGASLFAVGISLKDSISNLVSGIILVVNKPIHVGDYIECEKSKGTVVKIEMMFTFLQSSEENQIVVIPNSTLISSSINRVSEYNMVKIECERKISFVPKMFDLKKYAEKEFLLNKNIFTVPAPEVKLQGVEDGISTVVLSVWCQKNKAESVNKSLEAMAEKFERKYAAKKK
ncbi:MAG: mechanosensitive ion channel [Clostridia bacterium]|nr:mechanosensitive ion channel [Clostridia bacterium]MBR2735525.1 mechanosensitive ion channel [Clostridia bacterium]